MNNTLNSSLGVNRLRAGFVTGKQMHQHKPHLGTPSETENPITSNDVYDLTTEDDDGGIVLNVNGEVSEPIIISDDADEDDEDDDDHSIVETLVELRASDTLPIASRMESHKQVDQQENRKMNITRRGNGSKEIDKHTESATTATSDAMVIDSVTQDSRQTSLDGPSFIIDTEPSTSLQVCLRDLTPSQVEHQIRYAFWYLDRHQIDLSRPVRCLNCQSDGHIDEACPQNTCLHCGKAASHRSTLCPKVRRCENCRERGHEISKCESMKNTTLPCDLCSCPRHQEENCPLKHYIQVGDPAKPIKLWISCCVCASRIHLVGDCPEVRHDQAARWSLRSLAPDQVTNLSVHNGMQKLEQEAENRDLRPVGMRIKGRAQVHHADASRRDQSDSDDPDLFFGYPPAQRDMGRMSRSVRDDDRESRYETLNTSGRGDLYRPPRNGFYNTDSFGRPRSRSPEPFRHRDNRARRSPSIDDSSIDSHRPSQGRDSYRQRAEPPPNRTQGGFSIQLPTRKSTSTASQRAAGNHKAKPPAKPKMLQTNTQLNRATTGLDTLTKKQRNRMKKNARAKGQA